MQRHFIISSEKHRVIMRADCVGVCCRIFTPFRFKFLAECPQYFATPVQMQHLLPLRYNQGLRVASFARSLDKFKFVSGPRI